MAILASDIMRRAGIQLQDEAHVRWTLSELAEWINDAVRAIVLARPTASTDVIHIPLQAGTGQSVPVTGARAPQSILNITRNVRASGPPALYGGAITGTGRVGLVARAPDWHDERKVPQKKEVRQYFPDEHDPLRFWVYPGNDGTGVVEATVSVLPEPVAPTGDGLNIAHWDVSVGLKEVMATPILDYVLYRAQSKDDVAANAARAASHFQAFAAAVGIGASAEQQARNG